MRATPEIEELLQRHELPYYRMEGDRRLFVVLVRFEELPVELRPAVLATRSTDLIVGDQTFDHVPGRFRKGWPHSLTDEEAAELGISKRKDKPAMMGGVEPTNIPLADRSDFSPNPHGV